MLWLDGIQVAYRFKENPTSSRVVQKSGDMYLAMRRGSQCGLVVVVEPYDGAMNNHVPDFMGFRYMNQTHLAEYYQ